MREGYLNRAQVILEKGNGKPRTVSRVSWSAALDCAFAMPVSVRAALPAGIPELQAQSRGMGKREPKAWFGWRTTDDMR